MKTLPIFSLLLSITLFTGCQLPNNDTQTTPPPASESSEKNSETDTSEPQANQSLDPQLEAQFAKYTDPKTNAVIYDDIQYWEENENAIGFFARPNTTSRNLPGVILIHEWWGLNDQIRETAKQFAQQGYFALAVDLYDGRLTTSPDEAREFAGSVREDMDKAFANLTAATEYLKKSPYVNDTKLASVGWCFGGGWSYEMAKNNLGVQSSVIYYGPFNPEDDLQQMRSTILGHFGETDAVIKVDDVEKFQANLSTLEGDHEVYIYPSAGHAFANQDNEQYDENAAKLAWVRTMQFLEETLNTADAITIEPDTGHWHGKTLVKGYPTIEAMTEPNCTEDCEEKQVITFQILQSASGVFAEFLRETLHTEQENPYFLPLGCDESGQIAYINSSDINGTQNLTLSPELSQEILAATAENPIAIKLTKERFSGSEQDSLCSAYFTQVEKFEE